MWKDSETEIDFLDYDYLIKILQKIITDDSLLPASIGVYGDWGSGKSSLMYMCKKSLEKDDKNVKCLVFNGWLFENYEDAKTAILGTILDEIGENTTLPEKAKKILSGLYESIDKLKLVKSASKFGLQYFLTGGVNNFIDLAIDNIIKESNKMVQDIDTETLKDKVSNKLENKELRKDIRKFQNEFAELLKETKISRLVVFVDELDRCSPDTILNTLEAIKLFLFQGNVAFIIGADERHISYAVKSKFKDIEGIQINIGQEYLEKLVQYPIRIPRLNSEEVEIYIACLLLQSELSKENFEKFIKKVKEQKSEDFERFNIKNVEKIFSDQKDVQTKMSDSLVIAKQLSSVLSAGLHGNPRQCKRFLNSLYMRLNMAEYKNKKLDRKILAKIMMLEYIKPSLFNRIATMSFNGTVSNEIKAFESNDTSNVIELKNWIGDKWFIDWCKIDPSLAEIDLNIYFYFTRTSLDEKISRISSILSPKAQEILDKLLSKVETKISSALKDSLELNQSENATIFEVIFEKISSETKISKEHFKSFMKFAIQNKDLLGDALDCLKSFSGDQIPLAGVPYIQEFSDKFNKKSEVLEMAELWGNTNSKLEKSIKAIFIKKEN
ncbi:KAP family P-loop NTPase fold protein [Longibaculum muris]|uniref:KAP family P-loop NTPase fold protein n=1 Tax=Longibaculum muris TaxID=1796628 RepID=UPI00189C7F6A|nr:P-loop NTPase fold protein [Longibaculum muris]